MIFHAAWCPFCQGQAAVLAEIARAYATAGITRVDFFTLNEIGAAYAIDDYVAVADPPLDWPVIQDTGSPWIYDLFDARRDDIFFVDTTYDPPLIVRTFAVDHDTETDLTDPEEREAFLDAIEALRPPE